MQLKPNQLTPVSQTARPFASTILFLSTCSQSDPVATLEVTELELLLELLELELFTELDDTELLTDELLLLEELLTLELGDLLELLVATELEDLLELEMLVATELEDLELDELLTAPPQIAPVMTGNSAVEPPFVPWKPNSADCPTPNAPFQLRLVAE